MRQNWCDMRRATKSRCVNGLICATCDCCMLSQESWNHQTFLRQSHVAINPFTSCDFDAHGMSHGRMFLSHRVNAPLWCYWCCNVCSTLWNICFFHSINHIFFCYSDFHLPQANLHSNSHQHGQAIAIGSVAVASPSAHHRRSAGQEEVRADKRQPAATDEKYSAVPQSP